MMQDKPFARHNRWPNVLRGPYDRRFELQIIIIQHFGLSNDQQVFASGGDKGHRRPLGDSAGAFNP